jgi:hypothetical protein
MSWCTTRLKSLFTLVISSVVIGARPMTIFSIENQHPKQLRYEIQTQYHLSEMKSTYRSETETEGKREWEIYRERVWQLETSNICYTLCTENTGVLCCTSTLMAVCGIYICSILPVVPFFVLHFLKSTIECRATQEDNEHTPKRNHNTNSGIVYVCILLFDVLTCKKNIGWEANDALQSQGGDEEWHTHMHILRFTIQ